MRTSKYFKYLMAMIIALSTSANVFAEQRGLKIYFSENNGGSAPQILVTDDNNSYVLPARLTVSHQGIVWANKARYWEMFEQDVTDRVIADYLDKNSQKGAGLKLTFGNFPYEVNMIQWNVMNDLLSSSILNLLDNYRITTTCRQYDGTGWQYTDEHWDMNFFQKNVTFGAKDVPWMEGEVLNGLSSFEIVERSWRKSPLGILINHETNLDDECRTFIKAGWNGKTGSESNIDDYDDDNWAFKVKFTLPDIRMRCKKISTGNVDNNITVQERGVHKIEGYISAHQGAVKLNNPADIDKFHFRYYASNDKITIGETSGIIDYAKASGDVNVTVVLMRGENVVCSYVQQIHVNAVDPNAAQIAIVFADGKKGYDITVGDENAQVQAIITKKAKDNNGYEIDITPKSTFKTNDYYYLYSVDDENIATIDPYSGKITAKKEGDVHVSAVLMYGTTVKSETYTYPLHVFAKHEGLEFRRINTYKYSDDGNSNYTGWKVTATNSQSYEWQSNNLLRVNTSINGAGNTYGVNDWKQIASFSTGASEYWRAICQEIAFDVYVPKYTKSITQYSFAGNAAIGDKKTHKYWDIYHTVTSDGSCKYGFEINYLNQKWVNGKPVNEQITLEQANTKLMDRMWDTNVGSVTETFARSGASSYTSNVGTANALNREIDNVTSPRCNENRKLTVYFAVMSYLWNDEGYPGDVSIGFKGTPTYTYYSTVKYYRNDGTETLLHTDKFNTESKTETMQLYQKSMNANVAPTRTGYTFIGWSRDPNATSAEYSLNGNFRVYDTENGGGMGPVDLYAVWQPNAYTVTLNHNGGSGENDQITVVYTQPMPENIGLVAPTREGYDFTGYREPQNIDPTRFYYDAELKSVRNYDKRSDWTFYANWVAHTTHITFDFQGGNYGSTEVTATYGQPMPTQGLSAPQRDGYTFDGYYGGTGGQGYKYYNADMTSVRTWYRDEREVTLYANWIPKSYTVKLDPQGGTGGSTSVTATYGQPLPSGLTAPTKPGYEFKGYYRGQNQEYAETQLIAKPEEAQEYGGPQYYDENMEGVEPWDISYNDATIYAHWAPKTFIVTLDAGGGVLPNPVVDDNAGNYKITKVSNSEMELEVIYKLGKTNNLVHSAAKKPGYELLGWFDAQGKKVIEVDEKSRNCYITSTGGYWEKSGDLAVWSYTQNITLTARYRQKYQTPYENVIAFDNEKVEDGEDWLWAVVNDLVGAAQEVYQNTGQQTMVFDLRRSTNMWTGHEYDCQKVMDELHKPEYAAFISPNLIVHFNTSSWNDDKCYNAVTANNECKDLRVTDRFPIKIYETFNAIKASYARDAGIVDDETRQAQKSSWGTLCLPYSVKNNTSDVKYYWLQSMTNNYMEFEEFEDDAVIPANTPVLYVRTDGDVSSKINIVEANKNVPKNMTYQAVTIDYANVGNLVEGTYPLTSADATIHEWEFRGNLQTSVFCGKDYNKDKVLPTGAVQVDKGDVYYFKQNKFTHLLPRRVINGVTYAAGKMTLYPYRAYFYLKDTGSSAKISQYSILVMGEDGTLDITDLLFGDGEGDGKIYDLSGVRVMKPVKGRLYIVNGQKKVYR